MRLRLLFLPALFAAFCLQAQTVNWVQKNGPLGGEIIDIEVDPATGKVFLLDANFRPFASIDNGVSWQQLTFGGSDLNFRDIEITNSTIFLIGSYDLYASTDGGVTFQERMTSESRYQDAYRLKRMPSSGNLVALCYNAIYTSTNDGETWSLTGLLSQADHRYLEVNAVDQIFILLQSTTEFVYLPFRSSDGGASFTEQSTGIPDFKEVMGLYGGNNGNNLYCLTNTDLYSSANGTTWASIKTGSITDEFINEYTTFGRPSMSYLEFSADGLGMFFVDNLNHKLHSKTIEATDWSLQSDAFPSGTLRAICASALNYPSATSAVAFFGTESGVYKTMTGGASVTENNKGLASVKAEQIVADNNSNLYIKTQSLGLLKSEDQGNTWPRITSLPTTLDYPLDYFFQTPEGDALFAHVDITLYRSTNWGSSWSPLTTPTGGFIWAGAAGADKLFGLQSNYAPASFHYSSDDGTSWNAAVITGLPADFYIYEDELFLASPEYMLMYVYDYGAGAYYYYSVNFTYDATTGAITTAVANPFTTSPFEVDDIAKAIAINGKYYLYDRFSSASQEIAISDDGGLTWVTHGVPQSTEISVSDNGYIFCIDGNSGAIHISRDDGATFFETTIPATAEVDNLRDVTIDNLGFAYLAFDGNYVYQSSHTIVLPAPLTDLLEIGHTSHAVALQWIDLNNYDRDIIIERSVNGTDFLKVGQISGWDVCGPDRKGHFIDASVQPSTMYTYRVSAKNEAGESAPTSTIAVTTPAECVPDLPENRSWSAINSGVEGYTLLTEAVDVGIKHMGEGKYEISDLSLGLTGAPEKSFFYINCNQTLVGDVDDLIPNGQGTWNGTTLTLKWRSCSDDKTETISLTLNATDPAPTKPAKPFAHVLSNTSIEVKWTPGYYESSYIVERSSTSGSTGFSQIATVNYPLAAYVDEDPLLTPGTMYYYRIKAANGNTVPLESVYSDAVSTLFQRPNFLVADHAISDYYAATLGSIWADFDNDGLDDYMTMHFDAANESASPVIFRNLGSGDFAQLSPDFGGEKYLFPAVADFDNDGYTDILLSGDESLVLDLFKGNGDFTFSKIAAVQLGALASPTKRITATSWGNVNNDARPDLLVMHDDDATFAIYTQNSDHSFTKAFDGPPSGDASIMAIWADYDNDGNQDFLKTSFDGGVGLYRNNGNSTFSEVTDAAFANDGFIGAAWGDYDNDGDMDLFGGLVTENALYTNNGDGTFTKDVSTSISEQNLCLSASWGDYNNDGYLDLITGSIPLFEESDLGDSPTRLFLRDPSVTTSVVFKRIDNEKLNDRSVGHYSVSNADADQNGLLDVAMASFAQDDNSDDLLPAKNTAFRNNSPLQNWSEVRLAPATGGTEAIGASVKLTAAGQTQMREIAAATSLASRNSIIAHFGVGSATTITNIQVTWPNGTVQNYPLPPINQILVIDEDVAGPAITAKTPIHNATDVATNTTITLQFDENNLPVPGKKLTITKAGESTPFVSIDVTAAVKTGTQYEFTLAAALEPQTEYYVILDAGAFRDRWANPSAAVGPAAWKFTTRAEPDSEAPIIGFTSPASPDKGFGSVSPTITVTDNVGVSAVVVSIRKISGSEYTEIDADEGPDDAYTVTLSEAEHFDATGAEFFITATDAAGNEARSPEAPGTHKIYLHYSADQAIIPSQFLGSEGKKTTWKVFSIPFDLATPKNNVQVIFDELAGLDSKEDYRLITIQEPDRTDWSEYSGDFSTISRGQGYFINIVEPKIIKLPDDLDAPANHRGDLFTTSLQPGWNMVGNPYLTQIDWADVSVYNDLSGDAASLLKYSGTDYTASSQLLQPYEGAFVNNPTTTPIPISIPFEGQTSIGGRKKSGEFDSDINSDQWLMKLKVHQHEHKYDMGAIGMSPDASLSLDMFDRVTPPRFFDYLEVNFSHPEHFQKRFTRDVVPTQSDYTWDFTVDSNLPGMAELTWNNTTLRTSGKDLFLLDVSAQKLANMKETGSYHFDPKESNSFRIYYGDNLSIAPETVRLGKAYPNPTNGFTTIAFSLPETGGLDQSVTLDIVDALGRTVGTIKQGRFNPGYHEAAFDATEMMKGFFTYRLTVQNRQGQKTEANKLIIK